MNKRVLTIGIVVGTVIAITPSGFAYRENDSNRQASKSTILIAGERLIRTYNDDCDELKQKLTRNISQQQTTNKKIQDLKKKISDDKKNRESSKAITLLLSNPN
jgi:hypothetical protein